MKKVWLVALAISACRPQSAPPVELQNGAVAADMPAARAIGEKVLADGGNAVDAAIAVALALGVENPASSGIGGGGFAVVWDARARRAWTLDFREAAPAGARSAHYLDGSGAKIEDSSVRGCRAIAVPGEVAGLDALHARFGSKPWRELVEPARSLAANGWSVPPYLAKALAELRADIAANPELAPLYIEADGTSFDAGDTLRDPQLATTLSTIAKGGARGFYDGEVATAIEMACRDVEGAVTRKDLAAYRPIWRQPLVGTFRGHDIVTIGAPAAGGAGVIEGLNILEAFPDLDRRSDAIAWHIVVETLKHVFADRATSFGDPAFAKDRTRTLTSKAYARDIAATIGDHTQAPGIYQMHNDEAAPIPTPLQKAGTTHVSIVDRWGNAVALTTSVNDMLGSLVRAPKAGVLLNDTMDDFSFAGVKNIYGLTGSKKNFLEPGKRPVSSMAPVIVLKDGAVRLVAGGSGGPRITTGTLQVVFGVIGEGRAVREAVELPRVHHHFDRDNVDTVFVEEAMPNGVLAELEERGHVIAPPKRGIVNAVEVRDGVSIAAPDSRKNGIAAVIAPEFLAKPAATPMKKTR